AVDDAAWHGGCCHGGAGGRGVSGGVGGADGSRRRVAGSGGGWPAAGEEVIEAVDGAAWHGGCCHGGAGGRGVSGGVGNESNNDSDDRSDKDSEETVKYGADSEKESDDEEEQESRLSEEARLREEEDAEELYRDVNINQGRGLQITQSVEDTHVILTSVNPDHPQESSSMSSFVSSMLNPLSDEGGESIFTTTSSQSVSLVPPAPIMTPSTIATITTSGEAPIPPPTIPSIILENLPTFNSAFRFEERLRLLETSFNEYRQTNQAVDGGVWHGGCCHGGADGRGVSGGVGGA
nr:hypothetical protein [Tanacetum cinerariifolium]